MRRILLIFLSILLLSSCVSRKRLTYMRNEEDSANTKALYEINQTPYLVQINDIINISIRSFDEEVGRIFNLSDPSLSVANPGELIFYLNGYTVKPGGFIELPVLGRIDVVGKTMEEIRLALDNKLKEYFKDEGIFSTIQLAGIKFTVIGDVNSPGLKVLYRNDVNIFEALASAGDISIVGDRKRVQIVRRYPEGFKYFELDLTEKDVISNPNFFIQPNDIINVKPLPAKSVGIGTTGFATVVSIVTLVSSTLLIIVNLQRL